ncbi:hypothetical protein E4U17_006254 [Claviceps sp. LM77 group G4]|nr:hypothetical protein E4U17_006254 [Claviceps sp. LM77 group G4]KAG6063168.1 hypothetical protein E4U33_006385 [Claviceps sp. LM78 group G4]KAG6071013.1 hypothetical protein E4U16_006434 [Claviceps sp. LM84 group G4]
MRCAIDPPENSAETQDDQEGEREIAELESRLAAAKLRLRRRETSTQAVPSPSPSSSIPQSSIDSPTHFLLLLSDSQLPIGSFAFSSGLESYLAHSVCLARRRRTTTSITTTTTTTTSSFSPFLALSLSSFAATTLPFVLAAHRNPSSLASLDDQLDAAVVCTVGRRASVAQGRALLSIWERSFRKALPSSQADVPYLREFSTLLRQAKTPAEEQGSAVVGGEEDMPPLVSAHLAPLFGVICAIVGLSLRQTAYVYLMSHSKALVSAAVRASMFGPYQAQRVLAGEEVQSMVTRLIEREWETGVEDAGQSVPMMDLWIGRHEVLYSRIFNS